MGAGATLGIAGCLGDDGEDSLRFGAIFIESGFASVYGESGGRGIEMAVDEINDDGGIDGREIDEVLVRDSEGSTEVGTRQARSLVEEDNVDAIVGIDSSAVAQSVTPLMEQLQTPLVITHAATPYVTARDGDRAVGNDYVFRNATNLAQNVYGAATVASDLDAQTWTTIGPDYAFGRDTWDYFRGFLNGLGADAEFVDEGVTFPELGSDDFTPHIRRLIDADPDAVVTSLWGGDLITFLGQAANTDFFDVVDELLMTVGAATDVLSPMGTDMPDGLWAGTRYWFLGSESDANSQFVDDFVERYERPPSYNAEGAYRSIYLLRDAIESGGSAAADDVVDALTGIEHSGPIGDYRISEESNQAVLPASWGVTAQNDEWGIAGLDPFESIDAPADELRSLLDGTDLPPGV
ncbi:ABC transporter substrate-binding protein [Haloferacaceae archaeon DSL9]